MSKPQITVVRAHEGVGVRIDLRPDGWNPSVSVQASAKLDTLAARQLAADLIAEADKVDAKTAAEEAKKARRKAYRDREVAAGRMKILSAKEFFGR